MQQSILDKAKPLFAKRRFQDVIKLLEPHVTQYVTTADTNYNSAFNKSFPFYFYLGLACLHAGDIGGAVDYLTCARRIKMTDPDLLCAQAVLHLRRGDTAKAIDYYLEAIEYNPNHTLSHKGLEFIRTHNTPEEIGKTIESGEIKKYYPMPDISDYYRKRRFIFAATAAAATVFIFAVWFFMKLPERFGVQRADLSAIQLLTAEKNRPIEQGVNAHYTLSENEVLTAYQNAQKYFQSSRDNLAQIEVNRILSSNATHSIKQKARVLMDYFSDPGFDTITDIITYEQAVSNPHLYLDCWTIWTGIPTKIQTDGENTSFDLLVGYDKRIQVDGVVPVFCTFSTPIDSERPIEVLGKIQQRGGVLFLRGAGIHQSKQPAAKSN